MHKLPRVLPALIVFGLFTPKAAAPEPSPTAVELFEKEVRPLLVETCAKCHGDIRCEHGLKLSSRAGMLKGGESGPAVVPGKPEESLLIRAVGYQGKLRMPPKEKLAPRRIEALTRWVQMGAPWPDERTPTTASEKFWSFQPVEARVPPAVKDTSWPQSPIDRFILARLEANGLTPAKPADKRALIRRATFDLTGLPPSLTEIDAFLTDQSPNAFAKVVDRLLASPQYGERWARHWLDVVRYADARDLIQLPAESDFREIWRYRDWVVKAFNRDLPYTDFLKYQIAGDLMQPRADRLNKDALVATGMLALADFVPGDVDKELMIADYVNDQIDVVGRGFMGLTLACARCHDHKFDPISTRDYYALAGIFFSTRLIPAPIEGNTPLIRIPLAAPAEIARVQAERAADLKRLGVLQGLVSGFADREYRAHLKKQLTEQTARHLVAACEYKHQAAHEPKLTLPDFAKKNKLNERLLAGWVACLDRDPEKQRGADLAAWSRNLRDAASGKLDRAALKRDANKLQKAFAAISARSPKNPVLLRFRADDPYLVTTADGHLKVWPNRAGGPEDAAPPPKVAGPLKTTAMINGQTKSVLRFNGDEVLDARRIVPPVGSLFIVYKTADGATPGRRLIGWEDSDVGRHGLGLMVNAGGGMHAILRANAKNGDIVHNRKPSGGFEIISVTWGPRGATLHRDGKPAGANRGIEGVTSDPGIVALRIGGPGSGSSPRFRGDIAEIRVYDQQLDETARAEVEADLTNAWFKPADPKTAPADPLADWFEELLSPLGPFWPKAGGTMHLLPKEVQTRFAALRREFDALKKKPPPQPIPQAVVVQDGGPKGTKHEGFKDAHVYIRGNHKRPGKISPRGFPAILAGSKQQPITQGSGRLQLAEWLASPDNPLTARVLVNRLWQHHFGDAIVRTANNFGERGERPTHPELLDYLARRFVQSGWSMKAMHRLIMLSAVYQQSSQASTKTLAADPENRLFSRANRRRLEAEAIRDSLLAIAGRLDATMGGPAFQDLAMPRRTLYLMSVRTGANASSFGALFDRPDPSSIIEKRGVSTTAPQALFMLNDPFVAVQAKALAQRIRREVSTGGEKARIIRLYTVVLGRLPTPPEIEEGRKLLALAKDVNPWERYCHLLLCTNEFLYVE
jgi:hypothetical protein